MPHHDAELARRRYDYDSETGEFLWREPPAHGPRSKMAPGRPAGTINPADGMLLLRLGSQTHSAARVAWLIVHSEWPDRTLKYRDADLPLPTRNAISNIEPSGQKMERLTHQKLLEILSYDASTGLFTWKITRRGVKAGRPAGTLKRSGERDRLQRYVRIDYDEYTCARLAWFYEKGVWPTFRLEYIDGDSANTRIGNLKESNLKPFTKVGGRIPEQEKRERRQQNFRRQNLKRSFNMTPEEYAERLAAQNGVCMICKRPETTIRYGRVQNLPVDHDHETGANRDLLCGNCNKGLGGFLDKPELLRAAIAYLEKWGIVEGQMTTTDPAENVVPLRKEPK